MQDAGKKSKSKSYKDLDIYKLSKKLSVEIHKMTLEDLPHFEKYEQASQIRRSSKSIVANIVEGYGRRIYKNEFVKFLTYAVASCDETKAHLEILFETGSINKKIFDSIYKSYEELGAKIYRFRAAVIERHRGS